MIELDISLPIGRKIRITIYHEEERAILESLSPDVYVKDILEEFGLKTFEEHIKSADKAQKDARL